ncbi:MAG: HD domain-containing protein [Candidatus Odinarchaeota archaeon]
MKNFSNYWNALSFAFEKYGNLKRKATDIPYVIHPVRITSILRAVGFNEFEQEELMIAALFHDLCEDTNTSLEEIDKNFGKKISSIVAELTKPETAKGRKKDLWLENFAKSSEEAKIIKMADRIDNLLEMVNDWTVQKQISYANQAKIILRSCGDSNEELADKLAEIIKRVLDNLKIRNNS